MRLRLTVNRTDHDLEVEPRELLHDVLRSRLRLTGTHAGCEHGSCGACTILLDGAGARACLLFAVQAAGRSVTTIEGVAGDGELHPVQRAFSQHHGLQCGFCTPGMVLTAIELLERTPRPDRETVERTMSGNLCRCTGYVNIVESIEAAALAWGEAR
jgi:carbon-monoxide dehydrogenase small subunit